MRGFFVGDIMKFIQRLRAAARILCGRRDGVLDWGGVKADFIDIGDGTFLALVSEEECERLSVRP